MSLATVLSRAQYGMHALPVTVEVHLSNGLPSFSIVGLPEAAVRESKDRVRAAILNSNFEFPLKRITVNLAPADLPKEGGRFDLPIALGLLVASQQLPASALEKTEFLGELSLSGEIRSVAGSLAAASAANECSHSLIYPEENCTEVSLLGSSNLYPARHILDVSAHLHGQQNLCAFSNAKETLPIDHKDFNEVFGQHQAKRALEIAAAGGHHCLMIGSPGTGKTMLAMRMPSILPDMKKYESIETHIIHSIGHTANDSRHWIERPFRAPHHTISSAALAGGGSYPKPGEISLAHNGILFLDEFTEFNRQTIEVLREPLETGVISIARAAQRVQYPAAFQLIGAMNPCANGCDVDAYGQCDCSPEQLRRYRNRLSAPLLDRMDLLVNVSRIPKEQLFAKQPDCGDASETIRARVSHARDLQNIRQQKLNRQLTPNELEQVCPLQTETKKILEQAFDRLQLSARAVHKILKVARTIADLEGVAGVSSRHINESIAYRGLDRLLYKAI